LSAMGVAQRNNKVLVSNSFGIPSLAKYDMHFPGYVMGTDPGTTVPNTLVDAILAGGATPKSVAVVTSKFPSVVFLSTGAREVFKKRGLREALWLEWEFGNKEFGPIASRLKDANADFLWIGTIGPESLQLLEAMHKIDYRPKIHFHVYPTPGPRAQSPLAANALTLTTFEQHAPFTNNPAYAEVIKTYNERAAKANLPDTVFELQAANAYTRAGRSLRLASRVPTAWMTARSPTGSRRTGPILSLAVFALTGPTTMATTSTASSSFKAANGLSFTPRTWRCRAQRWRCKCLVVRMTTSPHLVQHRLNA